MFTQCEAMSCAFKIVLLHCLNKYVGHCSHAVKISLAVLL